MIEGISAIKIVWHTSHVDILENPKSRKRIRVMRIFKSHEIIPIIAQLLPQDPVIIEAGAFQGHDSIRMANQWPNGTIHAFEPVPEIFEKLKIATAAYTNIHCYNLALSNSDGHATFYVSEKPGKPGIPSQAGSLYKPKERLKFSPIQFPSAIEVQTITLEHWAQQNNIDRIDCLWLDMQGNELNVLKAAPHILKNVKVIYTEVSFIESYEGLPQMPEVKAWIESQGFEEYGRDFENTTYWFFGNILFYKP